MPTEAEWTAAVDLLNATQDALLIAHINPDADTIGSALALGMVLRRRGVRVAVSFAEPASVPESLAGLDTEGLLVPPSRVSAADLVVALDTSSLDRLGSLAEHMATARATLVIDHHVSNTFFGTHHLVDGSAEATVVLVLDLLDRLGEPVDAAVARCLYAGLVTDTSGFQRATPSTHLRAARLVEAGVDTASLTRSLTGSHSFAWLGMLSSVLGRAVLLPEAAGGRGLVYTVVRNDDVAGIGPDEAESVVDIVRTAREAEVCAVLKELRPGQWAVSLRAVGAVDVREIAVSRGGGGHRLAAGFSVAGTEAEAVAEVLAAIG
ncbi:DHH family phosphoesterase [Labedaea rhizosphaerae]|uniref:Phosphoesterase RecJ-like protein n=1 Tax=Labedaea rhizosphaerae TaxID=598644 RepID=A0A4R6SDV6_LABRH|nr:DHH family phosphoesterase [Labedaea rhizosphaerae]TDP97295.1 phosphoesterase RecJ-like protein [Labedaea rhizosphaerae]